MAHLALDHEQVNHGDVQESKHAPAVPHNEWEAEDEEVFTFSDAALWKQEVQRFKDIRKKGKFTYKGKYQQCIMHPPQPWWFVKT